MLLAAAALTALLAGCAPKTREAPLPVEIPQDFSASGSVVAPERWWKAFADPLLDRYVAQALEKNFDLETAWYRLREAQAVVERESAALFPKLDGELRGDVTRQDGRTDEQLRLGLVSRYEVDLWGRIRSSVEAERYRARASLEDYRTAALSLSAEVARTWFQLLEARSQWDLLAAQVEANEKVLQLIKARFGSGLVRSVDILRQQQLVEATREQQIATESRIQVLEHLLAVLLGRPPQDEITAGGRMPQLPPLPETGLPLELVRRRPDLRRAHHLLHAADRELAAAISNRYPRLTLSASLATTQNSADDLFDAWLAGLGADLVAPLFDGGRRAAEVERSEAGRSQRLSSYAQATLTAFREVEDALVREAKQRERMRSLAAQVRLADQAYQRLRNEYFNGVSDYIEVLNSLIDVQQLRRDLLTARRELLEFRVALYRALAGGFETERDSAPLPAAETNPESEGTGSAGRTSPPDQGQPL